MSRKEVKYGQVAGSVLSVRVPAAGSQNFELLSGRFVWIDTNGRLEIADGGDAEIFGWAMGGDLTTDSTAGQDSLTVNIALDAIYRIPADAAVSAALLGEVCDVVINSNIQSADLGASSDDVIQIVQIDQTDIDNQTVQVRINPAKAGSVGTID